MTANTINDAVTMGVAITIMYGKLMVTTRMLGKEKVIEKEHEQGVRIFHGVWHRRIA